eukprot:c7235_g1_i2.p1 GENE.c7235_g1_i2~~c7235_g1_i2.p1  ORF type:complete len:152 (-),score=2.79 c7235_g1_i2:360-815(-)
MQTQEGTPTFIIASLPSPKRCIVCTERAHNTRLPCGHSVMCADCATNVLSKSMKCPSCRAKFTQFVISEDFVQDSYFMPQKSFRLETCQVIERQLPIQTLTIPSRPTPGQLSLFEALSVPNAEPPSHERCCSQLLLFAMGLVCIVQGFFFT